MGIEAFIIGLVGALVSGAGGTKAFQVIQDRRYEKQEHNDHDDVTVLTVKVEHIEEELKEVKADIKSLEEKIIYQMTPNGGKSMYDQIMKAIKDSK